MPEERGRNNKPKRVGSMWKPKPGAKSLGSGSMTINGWKQKFVIFRNDRKTEGTNQPDYQMMAYDPPEEDTYERKGNGGDRPAKQDDDDSVPF